MFHSNAPSRRQGNKCVAAPSSSTNVLLVCLENLLLHDHPAISEKSKAAAFPEESDTRRSWKPGKITDIMNNFKNGTLRTVSVKAVMKPEFRSKQQNESAVEAEKVSHLPFRQPTRGREDRASESILLRDPVENNSTVSSIKWTNQGLFTTHSSRSSSSSFPTTISMAFPPPADLRPFNDSFLLPAPVQPHQSLNLINGIYMNSQSRRMQDARATSVPGDGESSDGLKNQQRTFKTALEQLVIDDNARGIKRSLQPPASSLRSGSSRKIAKMDTISTNTSDDGLSDNPDVNELMSDERLKNIEPKMVEAVLNEVIEHGASTDWDDIAGLESVKGIIREIIIWPMQRPDIFTGLRGPPKGILLFGPPGTGKTMFGRLIATKSKSTFFNISASSLMSKWCGDGEKMVRALFQVARIKQPAVIFIDEIDSILTQRSDAEHESSRRLKTEFLIQFDGCGAKAEDKLLVIGVTNRPQELDDAARRRLVKRIYIPLPDANGRQQLVRNLLKDQHALLSDEGYQQIASLSDGYSGADMASLCKEAAYGPIRDIGHDIQNIQADMVRPIQFEDFEQALKHVKPSVASSDLSEYEIWDRTFGCHT